MSRLGRARRQKPTVWLRQSADLTQSVSPDIITQTGSVFSFTRIDQNVNIAAVIDRTGSTFTPQVNIGAAPSIITNTGTVFTPTVISDQSVTVAAIIDSTGATFAPSLNVVTEIDVDLIDQTGTVYDPAVLQPRSYIAWVQLQVPGAPEILVTVDTIGNPGTVFAPSLGNDAPQEVTPELIDHTGQVFTLSSIFYGGNHKAFGLVVKSHDVENELVKGDDVFGELVESMRVTAEVG